MTTQLMKTLILVLCLAFLIGTGCLADRPSHTNKNDVSEKIDSALQKATDGSVMSEGSNIPQINSKMSSYAYSLFQNQTVIPTGSYDEQIQQLEEALLTLTANWEVTDAACSETSCSGHFSKTNGDTAVATLSYFSSLSDAQAAYTSAKNAHGELRVVDIAVGDGGYAWQYQSQSEAGFIEGQTVGIVDYYAFSGTATISDAEKVAMMIAKGLC